MVQVVECLPSKREAKLKPQYRFKKKKRKKKLGWAPVVYACNPDRLSSGGLQFKACLCK
jgi:hypothetical protein